MYIHSLRSLLKITQHLNRAIKADIFFVICASPLTGTKLGSLNISFVRSTQSELTHTVADIDLMKFRGFFRGGVVGLGDGGLGERGGNRSNATLLPGQASNPRLNALPKVMSDIQRLARVCMVAVCVLCVCVCVCVCVRVCVCACV